MTAPDRDGRPEALREAADLAIGCEHTTAMKWCGICQQWVNALIERADRLTP